MKAYFDAEMRLLNEAAVEFAQAYPEQASMLNITEIRDRDPYIERLLEGMAYLTAQIRSRIDDDVPEICQTLLSQMWPQFTRPFPSSTVIEFKSKLNQLQMPHEFPKGTVALSNSVGKEHTICEYRTTAPVILNPLSISHAGMEELSNGGMLFKLDFEINAGATTDQLRLDTLPIYLHGYPALTLDLWHALTTTTREVSIRYACAKGDQIQRLGGQPLVLPTHMDLESSILPRSGRSFAGNHLLHEYFCFREKFLFITLLGLNKVHWPAGCKKFSLEIKVSSLLPGDYRIDGNTFRLHCAPAVNLFPSLSDPVRVDHRRSEYRMFADAKKRESVLIYSVDDVEGIGYTSGNRYEYQSIHSLSHRADKQRHYHVQSQDRGLGQEDTFISVGGTSEFEPETLGCRIMAYNGHYPRRYLQEGSIRVSGKEFPSFAELVNITRPTPTYMPPNNDEYRWGFVAHLGLNYSSLTDLDTLKRLLHLYEWTGRKDNQRKIDGIKEVALELYQELHKGALMRGMQITLTIHEGNFSSISDIAMFGQILHSFFTMYANINTIVRSRVLCHPSGKELIWEPVLGETSLM